MNFKKALITGISGQDGSYLAELLVRKNYLVFGIGKSRESLSNDLINSIEGFYEFDLLEPNPNNLKSIILDISPDEIYHLAAFHFSSAADGNNKMEFDSFNRINLITANIFLETIKDNLSNSRFFYAASSHVFGRVEKFPQTDYFFCRTSIFDTHSENQYSYSVNNKLLNRISEFSAYLFHKNLIGAPSTGFFKNGLVETYDKLLIWLVDIEFYCRILKANTIRGIDSELITTTISEKQLTTKLKNNRNVELREFFYCYKKLIGDFDRINRKIMRHRMLDLFKEFHVSSIADLNSTGIKHAIPIYASLFFAVYKFNPKFAFRLFYKLNHFSIP